MKSLSLLILLFYISFSYKTNAQQTVNLQVTITGLTSNKGQLLVGLYNNKNHFLKTSFKGDIVKIKNKTGIITFKNIPKGEYAVSFIHDENSNNKMDTNFIGIPKEDYGCSNNAKGFMGPPKYKDAKFTLTADKRINITL